MLCAAFKSGSLLWRRVLLVFLFPFLEGHAVDQGASMILRYRSSGILRRFGVPVGEAVSAETGKIHEIDILNIASLGEMLEKPPKG